MNYDDPVLVHINALHVKFMDINNLFAHLFIRCCLTM